MHGYYEDLGTYTYTRAGGTGRRLSAQTLPGLCPTTADPSPFVAAANALAAACGTPITWPHQFFTKRYTVAADIVLDVPPGVVASASLQGATLAHHISRVTGGCALCSDPEETYPPSMPPDPPPPPPLPPPALPPYPPPPPSLPPYPCGIDSILLGGARGHSAAGAHSSVHGFALITLGDAVVGSHNHGGAFAIGGSLYDSTPGQHATVAGRSYIGRQVGDEAARFHFEGGGVVYGPGRSPFDFTHFERLAEELKASTVPLPRERVYVVCSGGTYDFSDFCKDCPGGGHDSPSGYNILVVFNTAETVTLRATKDGRQWFGSVLAPFAHVIAADGVGFIDGTVIARSYASWDGSVQLHGYGFRGTALCGAGSCSSGRAGGGTGTSRIPGQAGCIDQKRERKCVKKARKGKCSKRRVQRKCTLTCGMCGLVRGSG